VHIGWTSRHLFFRTRVNSLDTVATGIQIITVSGSYEMAILLPTAPGNLLATVYSDSFFNLPVRNELRDIDFSCVDQASYPVTGQEAFSLRWSGFFKPTQSAV
jgi:hypothetical protein